VTESAAGFRRGVRIGIDIGTVRVGVARSDPDGMLAVPVETVARDASPVARIAELVAEHAALEVVVGHPLNMSGERGPAARAAEAFAAELADRLPGTPVRLVDERLTTVSAQRNLHASGRTHRQSRAVVDQAAAVIVVQNAIDGERVTGRPVGTTVRRRDP